MAPTETPTAKQDASVLPFTPSETERMLKTPEVLQALVDMHDWWETCADGMDIPDSAKYRRDRREQYRLLLGNALIERGEG